MTARSSGMKKGTRSCRTAKTAGCRSSRARTKEKRDDEFWRFRPTGRAGADSDCALRLQPHHLSLAGVDGAADWQPFQHHHLGWRAGAADGGALLPLSWRAGRRGRAARWLSDRLLVAALLGSGVLCADSLGGDRPTLCRTHWNNAPPAPACANCCSGAGHALGAAGGDELAGHPALWRLHPAAGRFAAAARGGTHAGCHLACITSAWPRLRPLCHHLCLLTVGLAGGAPPTPI